MSSRCIKIVRSLTENNDVAVGYNHGDLPCMHFELRSPAAVSAAKHQLVFKEMEFCEALLEMFLLKMDFTPDLIRVHDLACEQDVFLRSAYVSSVVTYAKAFMSVGKGRMRLDPKKIFKNDGSGYGEFHSWIMEKHRHEYVAHANGGDFEDSRTVLLFYPPYVGVDWRMVLPHAKFMAAPHPKDVEDFLAVVRYVKKWVAVEIKKLTDHILGEVKKRPIGELYSSGAYVSVSRLPLAAPEVFHDLASKIEGAE